MRTTLSNAKDAFTKGSMKRYRKVSRYSKSYVAPEGHDIIPGRERVAEGVSDRVYVDVRRYVYNDTDRYISVRSRYYFNTIPSKEEVHSILDSMVEALEERHRKRMEKYR